MAYAVPYDDDGSRRAFHGDEHAPWDEWANVDFARRVGIDWRGDLEHSVFDDRSKRAKRSSPLDRAGAEALLERLATPPVAVASRRERVTRA